MSWLYLVRRITHANERLVHVQFMYSVQICAYIYICMTCTRYMGRYIIYIQYSGLDRFAIYVGHVLDPGERMRENHIN